jgi:hypothetical protein
VLLPSRAHPQPPRSGATALARRAAQLTHASPRHLDPPRCDPLLAAAPAVRVTNASHPHPLLRSNPRNARAACWPASCAAPPAVLPRPPPLAPLTRAPNQRRIRPLRARALAPASARARAATGLSRPPPLARLGATPAIRAPPLLRRASPTPRLHLRRAALRSPLLRLRSRLHCSGPASPRASGPRASTELPPDLRQLPPPSRAAAPSAPAPGPRAPALLGRAYLRSPLARRRPAACPTAQPQQRAAPPPAFSAPGPDLHRVEVEKERERERGKN